ncbi:MAG: glycosyltransferase family 9 protein [Promethearchaeota archaeon]|jgi:hypothetical protein
MNQAKALYIPCYPGELGWELINYVPYVNSIFHNGMYAEVHAVPRIGREALYPMATHFHPIDLPTKKSMGNSGLRPPKNGIVKGLRKRFSTVDCVVLPTGGCRYVKPRRFLVYKADEASLQKWRHIPVNSIVCSVRGRDFGVHKNWPGDNWRKLCEHIIDRGFRPVIVGMKELVDFQLPEGCIDVRDRTTMADLIAIMQKSRFVIGQSSGPMHLASLCQVPHAVWGSPRLHDRYAKSWNPHKTMMEYHHCREFQCTLEDALGLADRLIQRL